MTPPTAEMLCCKFPSDESFLFFTCMCQLPPFQIAADLLACFLPCVESACGFSETASMQLLWQSVGEPRQILSYVSSITTMSRSLNLMFLPCTRASYLVEIWLLHINVITCSSALTIIFTTHCKSAGKTLVTTAATSCAAYGSLLVPLGEAFCDCFAA